MEIANGQIESARIFVEDHGILTSFLQIKDSGGGQGFGGYFLDETLASWVKNLFRVFNVDDFEDLVDLPCRVKRESWNGPIVAIGHYLNDEWFTPETDLKNDKKSKRNS